MVLEVKIEKKSSENRALSEKNCDFVDKAKRVDE